jgi:hypothetical protein
MFFRIALFVGFFINVRIAIFMGLREYYTNNISNNI